MKTSKTGNLNRLVDCLGVNGLVLQDVTIGGN